jgi:mgtE-like transporter
MNHDPELGRRRRLPPLLRWVVVVVRVLVGAPARAARGTARRVADPARQVVDYWASERTTMRHGFVAVCIASVTSLAAGLVLVAMEARIEAIPGLLLLIPVSIGMRGNIFGALAARLGTTIHSGLFDVSRDPQGLLFQNVQAATLLTLGTSVTMAILARGIASLLSIDTVSVWDLIVVALVGGLLSSVVVLAVTVWLSITSYRRGWDLDSVGAPLITAMGDVVTLPSVFLASYLVGIDWVTPIVGAVALIAGGVAVTWGWSSASLILRRIVRESFPILCVAIVLDVLAGTVVEPRVEGVFGAFPAFLIVIPGFLENTGALGSILAARLGSKLHLGAVTPSAKPEPAALLDGSIVLALGVTVFGISAFITLGAAELLDKAHPSAITFVGVVMAGGLVATLIASFIGYYAAIATYRFQFDPDNHTIPLVTSGMDLLGVICLVGALVVFGVA